MTTTTLPNRTAIRKMNKPALIEFGRSNCLLEHVADVELSVMPKTVLLDEILSAFTRIEIQNDREAFATDSTAKSVAETLGLAEPKPAKKATAKSERRNETSHADGALTVELYACPTCKAKKGAKCIRHDGERTNHVHAARMARFDAQTPEAAKS
jgi:hypothetical protein